MPATATIRDLRNRFPKIRKLVESEGEVLLSESGRTKYRLVLHTPVPAKAPPPVDYWRRLTSYHPTPLTAAQSRALHEDNRGDR
jgi:antitoxin (DNA-binding transcriptional repressor) of toxin-antitoxin stability system